MENLYKKVNTSKRLKESTRKHYICILLLINAIYLQLSHLKGIEVSSHILENQQEKKGFQTCESISN